MKLTLVVILFVYGTTIITGLDTTPTDRKGDDNIFKRLDEVMYKLYSKLTNHVPEKGTRLPFSYIQIISMVEVELDMPNRTIEKTDMGQVVPVEKLRTAVENIVKTLNNRNITVDMDEILYYDDERIDSILDRAFPNIENTIPTTNNITEVLEKFFENKKLTKNVFFHNTATEGKECLIAQIPNIIPPTYVLSINPPLRPPIGIKKLIELGYVNNTIIGQLIENDRQISVLPLDTVKFDKYIMGEIKFKTVSRSYTEKREQQEEQEQEPHQQQSEEQQQQEQEQEPHQQKSEQEQEEEEGQESQQEQQRQKKQSQSNVFIFFVLFSDLSVVLLISTRVIYKPSTSGTKYLKPYIVPMELFKANVNRFMYVMKSNSLRVTLQKDHARIYIGRLEQEKSNAVNWVEESTFHFMRKLEATGEKFTKIYLRDCGPESNKKILSFLSCLFEE